MFTQRHFEATAAVFLRQARDIANAPDPDEAGDLVTLKSSILRMAGLFSNHNSRFNPSKFFEACGLDEKGRFFTSVLEDIRN